MYGMGRGMSFLQPEASEVDFITFITRNEGNQPRISFEWSWLAGSPVGG